MKHACEKISRLASEHLERELSFKERLTMRIHFLMCSACKHYYDNIAKLHQVFKLRKKQLDAKAVLPPTQRERIKAAIEDIAAD